MTLGVWASNGGLGRETKLTGWCGRAAVMDDHLQAPHASLCRPLRLQRSCSFLAPGEGGCEAISGVGSTLRGPPCNKTKSRDHEASSTRWSDPSRPGQLCARPQRRPRVAAQQPVPVTPRHHTSPEAGQPLPAARADHQGRPPAPASPSLEGSEGPDPPPQSCPLNCLKPCSLKLQTPEDSPGQPGTSHSLCQEAPL